MSASITVDETTGGAAGGIESELPGVSQGDIPIAGLPEVGFFSKAGDQVE